jgi:hypothetical protein
MGLCGCIPIGEDLLVTFPSLEKEQKRNSNFRKEKEEVEASSFFVPRAGK